MNKALSNNWPLECILSSYNIIFNLWKADWIIKSEQLFNYLTTGFTVTEKSTLKHSGTAAITL